MPLAQRASRPVPRPRCVRAVADLGRRTAWPAVALALLTGLAGDPAPAAAQTVHDDHVITNGSVNATVIVGDTLYIGGSFGSVGPVTGSAVPIDVASGTVIPGFPRVDGTVSAVIPDGAGGWFLGGTFTAVGGQARANLAHVLADQSVSAWNPGTDNTVRALAVADGVLYAGGTFTVAGGSPRNRIAAFDAATGALRAWNANANSSVFALAVGGGTVYAGGTFTTIGGTARTRVAALDTTTGAATGFSASANSQVSALLLRGPTLYLGGSFSNVSGQVRARIAAVDAIDGLVLPWNPSANNQVLALAYGGGSVVHAGGAFSIIGGQARARLAALDTLSGLASAWNPGASAQVTALAARGDTVFAGGDFLTVGGQPRSRIAAIDGSGAATAWNPNAFGTVSALAVAGGTVYAGGTFRGMGGEPRANLAALDLMTGGLLGWNPALDGAVHTLAARGGVLYAGGDFTHVGALTRARIAAIDRASAIATAWDPSADGQVSALALDGARVYAGGAFGTIGGAARSDLAALDAATGLAVAWAPDPDGQVYALAVSDSTVFVGGFFTSIGGQSRSNLAAVSASTGLATAWDASANGTLRALTVSCGTLYAGGFFTTLGAQSRNSLAALDVATAAVRPWNPDANGPVFALALGGMRVYAGGVFNLVGGQSRSQVAAIDAASGLASTWNPSASGTVRALGTRGDLVAVGGSFATIGGLGQSNIAVVDADATLPCANATLSPPALAEVRVGTAYAQTFVASGGGGSYCYRVSAGSLPPGLTFDGGSGVLTGTPTEVGLHAFTVTATYGADCAVSVAYTLNVRAACTPLAIATASLPPGRAGTAYAESLVTSAGIAPFTFTLTAGALPAGLTLTPGGTITGTPAALGTSTFTVGVTDSNLCTASRAFSLVVFGACPAIAVNPPTLPSTWVGAAYAQTLVASAGTLPVHWSVRAGALPAGLALDSLSGALSGSPTTVATTTFTVTVRDSTGCTGQRSYTLGTFAAAPTATIAAQVPATCVSTVDPCVSVPVTYSRTDTTPVRAVSVTFQLDAARLALCAPGAPALSLHPGSWTGGAGATFQVIDHGSGRYTVDQAILGVPCGPNGGDTLFTIDLKASGPDGTGTVAVTAVRVRDCDNATLAVGVGPSAPVVVVMTPPAAIADLAVTRVLTGNGADSTLGMRLTWTGGGAGIVRLYRAPMGAYPVYGDSTLAAPDSALAPAGPWTLVASGAASPYLDESAPRGFWYHVALVTDSCGNVSAVSNRTRGALDYLLGDVTDGAVAGRGDDAVGTADVSLLGAHYGIGAAEIVLRDVRFLDVGPTLDGSASARPTPDDSLGFEDLMMFSATYGTVAQVPSLAARPVAAEAVTPDTFQVLAPGAVVPGQTVIARLWLGAGGGTQGFSARLGWDPAVVRPVATRSSGAIEARGGVMLAPRPGVVDAALLGIGPQGITGAGEVATVTFEALAAGDAGIHLASVDARDASNRPLAAGSVAGVGPGALPGATALLAPAPNPFRSGVALAFALARPGTVELAVHGVDGRRVRTVARGRFEAGVHRLVWDGRDDAGRRVPPGVFFARFAADGERATRTLVLVR